MKHLILTFVVYFSMLASAFSQLPAKIARPELFIGSPDNEYFFAAPDDIDSSSVCAFVSNAHGSNNIYLRLQKEGSGFRNVRLTEKSNSNNGDPYFSKDGSTLLFITNRNDAAGNIRYFKFDAGYNVLTGKEFIFNETIEFLPVTDSGCANIYFCQKNKNVPNIVETKIVKMDFSGTIKKELLTGNNIISIAVSPDNLRLYYITKDSAYSIGSFDLETLKSKKIYSSANKINSLFVSDDSEKLYFTEFDNLSKNNVLYRIENVKNGNYKKIQNTLNSLDILQPQIIKNNLYFISYKEGSKNNNGDIYILKGAESANSEELLSLPAESILNIADLQESELKYEEKKYFITKYLDLNSGKMSDKDIKTVISGLFDYFLFLKKYEDLKLLNEYHSDTEFNNLIKTVSKYYLYLNDKSQFELNRMKSDFIKSLDSIITKSKSETVKIKAEETLADLYSDAGKFSEALILYDTVFLGINANSDSGSAARLTYKKALIYEKLGQENVYISIMTDLLKKYGASNYIADIALNDIVKFYSDEKKNAGKISVINYLTDLSQNRYGLDSLSVKFLFKAAELAYRANENFLSKKILNDIIEKYPGEYQSVIEANIKLGDILFAEEEFEKSLEYYKNANSQDIKKIILQSSANLDESQKSYLNEKLIEAEEKFKRKTFEKGLYEEKTGDYQKAFKTFYKLIEFDAGYDRGHRELIKIGNFLNKLEELEKTYDGYLKKNFKDNYKKASLNYAYSLLKTYKKDWKENLDASQKLVLKSIRLKPGSAYYYQLLGWINEQSELVLGKEGRFEYAVNNYKTAFALTEEEDYKSKAELLSNIGNIYYHINNYEMAYRYYNQVLELYDYYFDDNKERQIVFYMNLAYSAFSVEDYSKAELYYKKAFDYSTESSIKRMCLEKLSLIYYSNGKYSKAVESLNEAVTFGGDGDSPQKKYFNKRAVLLFMMNYLTDNDNTANEVEKIKIKNQISKLIKEAEKYFKESFTESGSKSGALIDLKFNLTGESSGNSEGLDALTEQKFLYMLSNEFYKLYGNNDKSLEILFKRIGCIPEKNITPKNSPALFLEKAVLLNNISKTYFLNGNIDSAVIYAGYSIKECLKINEDNGIYVNMILLTSYLNFLDSEKKGALLADLEKYYKLIGKNNVYFDFSLLSVFGYEYYKEFILNSKKLQDVTGKIFTENQFDSENISLFDEYIKIYTHKAKSVKYLEILKNRISESNENGDLIQILKSLSEYNLNLISSESSDNQKDLSDSAAASLADSFASMNAGSSKNEKIAFDAGSSKKTKVTDDTGSLSKTKVAFDAGASNKAGMEVDPSWLNFYSMDNIDDLINAEKKFRVFANTIIDKKIEGFNFITEKLLYDLYGKIIIKCLENKEIIPALVYIDRYIIFSGSVKMKDLRNGFAKILEEEDIYYVQSLIGKKNFDVIFKTELKTFHITISAESFECNDIMGSDGFDSSPAGYAVLVNCGSEDLIKYGEDRVLVPSLSGFIKSRENHTVFTEKIKVLTLENINNFVENKDFDIINIDGELEINPVDLTGSRIINYKTGFSIGINYFRDAGTMNINFLALRNFKNKNIDSEKFNCIVNYLIESGISNAVFTENVSGFSYQELINAGGKKKILAGGGTYDDSERKELAASKTDGLVQDAVEEYGKRNYNQALSNIQRVIGLDRVLNYDKKTMSKYLKFAINCAYNSQDFPKAVEYQRKYMERSALTGGAYAKEAYNLGIFYSMNEEYDSAAFYFNEALKNETADSKFQTSAKTELSKTNEFRGDYTKAISYIENIIAATDKPEILGKQYSRLGKIYYLRLNDYLKAEEYFRKALKLFEDENDSKSVARTLIDIGAVLEQLGRFAESRDMFSKSLELSKSNGFNILISEIYQNFANSYWYEGDYKPAFDYSFKSADISKQNNDDKQLYISYNTIGLIYWTLNNPAKSLYYLNMSLDISKKLKDYNDISSTLNNIAIVKRTEKKYIESIDYLNQAVEIDKRIKSRWALGYDYRNLGMAYLSLNDLKNAKHYLESAYSLSVEINNYINIVKCGLELGNLNLKLNDFNAADNWYSKSFDLAEKSGIKEVVWRCLFGKAMCFEKSDKNKALLFLEQAVEKIEKTRASLKIEELKNGFVADKKDVYDKIIKLYIESGNFDKSFEYLERFKSRSLIDLLGNHKIKFNDKQTDMLYAKIISNKILIDNFQKQINYEPVEWKKNAISAQISKLELENSESLLKMKLINPEIESVVEVNVLSRAELKTYLDSETVILEYYADTDYVYVWIISKDKFDFIKNPVPPNFDLTKSVNNYMRRIQDKAFIDDISMELYDVLFERVEKYAAGKKYICVIPNGIMHYIPFSALRNKDYYLIDKYNIFYLTSASLAKYVFKNSRVSQDEKPDLKILAVGNPDLGDFNLDLPLSGLEAKSIQFEFNKADILLNKSASKSWIVKNIGNYDVIHLAAHGEFDSVNPLFSALKLHSEKNGDGDLRALEVFDLKLKADMVALSACQSGLGKIQTGDEIIGLNRAFFYAGTKSIVSSMWRIDDLSTSLLMKHFYRNYLHLNKIESIRAAQLKVKSQFPHPMYWAGLFLSGNYN